MPHPRLVCTICGVEVILDEDANVAIAEVQTFCAAHNTHEEGVGVTIDVPVEPDDEETA